MAITYEFVRTLLLPIPTERAFSFFEDAKNLELITPDFLGFRILTPTPIQMRLGTSIDYRIRLFGIPMRWKTLIEQYDPPNYFVDTQVKGPYKLWQHTHTFRATSTGTEMTDHVRYQLRFGILGEIARQTFVKRTLKHIFDYRNQRIQELMLNDPTFESSRR